MANVYTKKSVNGLEHRPPPSSSEIEGRVELYICSAYGPSWLVLGRTLPLYLPLKCKWIKTKGMRNASAVSTSYGLPLWRPYVNQSGESLLLIDMKECFTLTLILLTWTIWRAPTNASKCRMGFNPYPDNVDNMANSYQC